MDTRILIQMLDNRMQSLDGNPVEFEFLSEVQEKLLELSRIENIIRADCNVSSHEDKDE